MSTKAWNKLIKVAEEWPAWAAALVGAIGKYTEKGFTLANPGLQVFECKLKAPAEAASPAEAERVAPLTSPPVARPAFPTAESATASVSPARRRSALSLRKP